MNAGKLSGLILPLLLWGCLGIIASAHAQTPSIVVPPASQSSAVGGTIQFTVSATGGGTLAYQWRKNGTNLVNGVVSGAALAAGVASGAASDVEASASTGAASAGTASGSPYSAR